jgi:RNA polymerase sigma factor (sigma-70 family)
MSAAADYGPSVSAVASGDQGVLDRRVCELRPSTRRSPEATASIPATDRIRSAPVVVARAAHPAVREIGRDRGLTNQDGSRPQAHRRRETVTLNHRTKPGTAPGRLSGEEVAELVRSAAAGDDRSWEALVREFGGMVWAISRSHRLSDADAADVVQTTWLRLVKHLDGLNDPARVRAWVATTARRECLRVLRAGKRHAPLDEASHVVASRDIPPDEALIVAERDRTLWRSFSRGRDRDMPPDETLLVAVRDRALWRSFSRLQPTDQALLRLLMADPRPPYQEISAVLEMPIGSIGPTRARALGRLRQELDNEGTLTLMMAGEKRWWR